MTKEYHVVYRVEPEIGTRQIPRICEEVAETPQGLAKTIYYLTNRNEDILGVYVTGSEFGTPRDETRQLREFRSYLEDLIHQVWAGKKL